MFNLVDDLSEACSSDCLRALLHEALASLARHEELGLDRYLAEERYLHLRAHLTSASGDRRKNLTLVAAIRAHEATHIFDDAEDACPCLLAKIDLLAHIGERNFLRCRDNDCAEHVCLGEVLDHGNVLI